MKNLIFISLVIITGIVFSCKKSEKKPVNEEQQIENIQQTKDKQMANTNDKDNTKQKCFEMVYPIIYNMPDGSTITIEEHTDWKKLKEWYNSNSDAKDGPKMQYPVEVNFKGKVVPVNNDEEMKKIKMACKDENKPCFTFVFPLSYEMPDGNIININDEKDIENRTKIKTWYKENPDSKERPVLLYPLKVNFKEKVLTINNLEEMIKLKENCK